MFLIISSIQYGAMQNDFDNNQLKYQISTGDQIPFQLTW